MRQAQPHLPIAEADRARRVWSQLAVISRSYMLRIEKVYVMLLKNAIVMEKMVIFGFPDPDSGNAFGRERVFAREVYVQMTRMTRTNRRAIVIFPE